jgi:hypothetical protein
MTHASRRTAGILLILLPTVVYGGVSILMLLINDPRYVQNALRQDLWRAGHAHAGVLLVLALVALRYVDEAKLSDGWKWFVREAIPAAAILLPAAFFLSVASPAAGAPNGLIYLAYVGALVLASGLVVLGIGLMRNSSHAVRPQDAHRHVAERAERHDPDPEGDGGRRRCDREQCRAWDLAATRISRSAAIAC